jgi:large subunit ribosomal protein L23
MSLQKMRAGLTLEPYQVILRPLVTEKGVQLANELRSYTFEVHRLATKDDIKAAVETLFNVKVTGVSTQNRKGKARRTKGRLGFTKPWKKAIVTLDEESRIDFI